MCKQRPYNKACSRLLETCSAANTPLLSSLQCTPSVSCLHLLVCTHPTYMSCLFLWARHMSLFRSAGLNNPLPKYYSWPNVYLCLLLVSPSDWGQSPILNLFGTP